ncbi:hypothetical protein ACFCV8_29240 [Streptomyces sp. NPDC056347]|uniref:hypothetical protein n=1 Tax=Streptomyces sp. NPDC056347 TaxID=3345790 RepID=UPI0035D95837
MRPEPRFARVVQWTPPLVALMAMAVICLLAVLGQAEQIPSVALFGGAVFAGGTIVSVTVNVRR